jgi:hypothetical protein
VKYRATSAALRALAGETIEAAKAKHGAWYLEHIGEAFARAGLMHLVERVTP